MDPIRPIEPGLRGLLGTEVPVERLERIKRERDRRHKDPLADERRGKPERWPPDADGDGTAREPGDGPHIDVRA